MSRFGASRNATARFSSSCTTGVTRGPCGPPSLVIRIPSWFVVSPVPPFAIRIPSCLSSNPYLPVPVSYFHFPRRRQPKSRRHLLWTRRSRVLRRRRPNRLCSRKLRKRLHPQLAEICLHLHLRALLRQRCRRQNNQQIQKRLRPRPLLLPRHHRCLRLNRKPRKRPGPRSAKIYPHLHPRVHPGRNRTRQQRHLQSLQKL